MAVNRELPPTAYSADHAYIDDAIHAARGRDWSGEAEDIARIVRSLNPDADSLLDVACGTGRHMEQLAKHFDRVEGLEISDGMRRMAAERIPELPVHAGDMREFDGYVTGAIAESEGRVISRVSHSARGEGARMRMTVKYTVAERDGINVFTEYEDFTLFDRKSYEAAFEKAGVTLEFTEGGPNGRGLFTGVRREVA